MMSIWSHSTTITYTDMYQARKQDFGWGDFFTKLRWTFPEGEVHIHSYSARSALLGGSGGMRPQEN